MAYIGNTPALQYITFAKQTFTADSSTVAFTLDNSVANENELEVFVNNVRQEPGSGKAYTASGTTLTMSEAPTTGDDFYCIYQGKATQTVTPGNGTVTNAHLAASIITGQTALGATPADTDELLISDAGTLKRVDFSHLKVSNTPAFEAKLSGTQNIGDDSITKLQFATEIFDTAGNYDNSTNYRFTPTTAGKYFCYLRQSIQQTGGVSQLNHVFIYIYKNGSAYKRAYADLSNNNGYALDVSIATTIDFNGSSDYIEAYALSNTISGDGQALGDTYGAFGAYKLIGV